MLPRIIRTTVTGNNYNINLQFQHQKDRTLSPLFFQSYNSNSRSIEHIASNHDTVSMVKDVFPVKYSNKHFEIWLNYNRFHYQFSTKFFFRFLPYKERICERFCSSYSGKVNAMPYMPQ